MHKNVKDLEIVSELAKEIAEGSGSAISNDSDKKPTISTSENKDSFKYSSNGKRSEKKSDKAKPPLTLKELAAKKQNQNLAERKVLLVILAVLLGLQLLFMNAVVLLIVLFSLFDGECFRALDADVLNYILDFTKYYVTAVLVELLGGIIYIIHRVFSEKN